MSWFKAKDWATGVEYSRLFHSGLRIISLTPHARRARTSSSSSSGEKSSSGGTSPIASLPPRLLKRSSTRYPSPPISISTDSRSASPSQTSRVTRPRPSSMFVRQTKEVADTWALEGSFVDIGDYPKFDEEDYLSAGYLLPPIELDGVRSLAGPRSFYVNLGEMDATGDESFLSLSSSPDGFLHHPTPRRERPVSMQTAPLPSRRSSLHYRTWEMRRDRGDCAWMLEGSSPELKAYDPGDEEEMRPDDERDWRQFHVDWVRNIR